MRSSSDDDEPRPASRWEHLVLGTVLVALALGLPAMGVASAQFGGTAQVTISISIAPTGEAGDDH